MQEKVREFEKLVGGRNPDAPSIADIKTRRLRCDLLFEEVNEVIEALFDENLEEIAKELADLLYVVLGTAVAYGIPLERVFEEVHRSNMTKIMPDGTIKYGANGKVIKPLTYQPADVKSVLFSAPK